MKTELKTKKTDLSVDEFIDNIEDDAKKADCKVILDLFKQITGDEPKMWGPSIIGFTDIHVSYASGRELDWFKVGFSPRKQNITLYILKWKSDVFDSLLTKLGKHTRGGGCLYIRKLADVDLEVLKTIIKKSFEMEDKY